MAFHSGESKMTWKELLDQVNRKKTIRYLARMGVKQNLSRMPDENLTRLKDFAHQLEDLT
jgi:hypothetical protein